MIFRKSGEPMDLSKKDEDNKHVVSNHLWKKRKQQQYHKGMLILLGGLFCGCFRLEVVNASSPLRQQRPTITIPSLSLPSLFPGRNVHLPNLQIRNRIVNLRNHPHLSSMKQNIISCSAAVKKRKPSQTRHQTTGFYYGLTDEFLKSSPKDNTDSDTETDTDYDTDDEISNPPNTNTPSRPTKLKKYISSQFEDENISMQEILTDTLTEFRSTSEELRDTLEAIRQEMKELSRIQKQMLENQRSGSGSGSGKGTAVPSYPSPDADEEDGTEEEEDMDLMSPAARRAMKRKRMKDFDKMAKEIEIWASHLLFEEGVEEDGWKDVECSKMLRKKFNGDGKTKCFLKWMPDPRGKYADPDDDKEYPCIRCYTTIDAPLEHVCAYLSDEAHMEEYNDLVVKHNDLEEISPHSKICWGQCPQILFIKPRDFVTFCHHRWKKDGTQIVVNQAVDHKDAPAVLEEGKSNACRAYAFRGANFLSRDPNDPNKTRFAILAHGSPGGGLPPWATKAAVNAVVPIEPFKLFYNIEKGVKQTRLDAKSEPAAASIGPSGRSSQPGGLSQLGYACFWPNGGGLKEVDDNDNAIMNE